MAPAGPGRRREQRTTEESSRHATRAVNAPAGSTIGTASVVAGSLVAAILAYVFQVAGGRALGPEAFAPISVLWTVQYLAIQVLYQPLEHYVNRETRRGQAPSLLRVLAFGAGAAVLVAGVMFLARETFFDDLAYVALSGLLVFGYAVFGYVRGGLAGAGSFGAFGTVTAGEAAFRLVVAAALLSAAGALGLAWAMVLAPFVAVAWLWQTGTGGPHGALARNLAPLAVASMFAQALLGLAPLAAAAFGAGAATISVVFMTFAIYRGPLWILQGLMARLMPVLVDHVREGAHHLVGRWMRRLVATGVALAAAGFALGSAVAPPVLAWLLGPEFRPDATFSGLVAAGVAVAACAGLANQVLLALDRLYAITGAWAVGFGVACAVALALPGGPALKVGAAFLAGELVAFAGLYLLYRRPPAPGRVPQAGDVPAGVAT